MADIAAGDVTYTLQKASVGQGSKKHFVFKVEFGNGSLTYPSGGVPLTIAKLGLPNDVEEAIIMDASDADGFVYKYNLEADKIRIYTTNLDDTTDGPLVELTAASSAVAAAVLYLKVVGY